MIGKLYFAWVGEAEAWDPLTHCREDESVFRLFVSEAEGEFAQADVEILNPMTGLLAAARDKYVMLSADVDGSPTLLLWGRVVGVPTDLTAKTCRIHIIAHKPGWAAEQATFLADLKAAPYYDELFIAEDARDEPEEILAGRHALLHWHRATGAISLSDILSGPVVDLDGDFFGDPQIEIGEPPLAAVNLEIEAQWQQYSWGVSDLGQSIQDEFPDGRVNTLTPDDFLTRWPGAGTAIGGRSGYRVIGSTLEIDPDPGYLFSYPKVSAKARVSTDLYPSQDPEIDAAGYYYISVPRVWFYKPKLRVLAEYKQKRRETLTASVTADTQEITSEAGGTETISVRLQDVIEAGAITRSATSFFLSTRGQAAAAHAVKRAEARLARASRAVEITIETRAENIIPITCANSVRIADTRLPGGEATGKVIAYSISIDGQGGVIGSVTIGCAIGRAGATGTVTYGDYSSQLPPTPVDSSDLTSANFVIQDLTIRNRGDQQNNLMRGYSASSGKTVEQLLAENSTSIELTLRDISGVDELAHTITLTPIPLQIPKQIDLEAA
jgi:hypothetical protein